MCKVTFLPWTTTYSVARLRLGDQVKEVDARPSDCFALAVRTGSPMLVSEEVMERAGAAIPEGVAAQPGGRGLDSIINEVQTRTERMMQRPQAHAAASEEERRAAAQKARQELMEYLFGVGA